MLTAWTRRFVFSGSVCLLGIAAAAGSQPSPRTGRTARLPAHDSANGERIADTLKSLKTRRTPDRRRFSFENTVANVYDSNVEHDSTNIGSYGVVAGGSAMYRSRSLRPMLQLEYVALLHRYTATDRWDRFSQIGRAGIDMPLNRVVSLGLTLEAFLKGSSEDREIGDQIAVFPRVVLRASRSTRFRFIGAYRKRYFETSTSNATNTYGSADVRVRFGFSTVEAAARVEENRPELSRLRFQRQTYTARYRRTVTDRDDLLWGVEYRLVKYPERFVDIVVKSDDNSGRRRDEDAVTLEVPRRDERWKPHAAWTRQWTRNLRTELEYEYEMRSSNDPDKRYRGHILTLTAARPW